MNWRGRRRSENIEDRRSRSGAGGGRNSGLLRLLPSLLSGKLGKLGLVAAAGIVILQFVDLDSFIGGSARKSSTALSTGGNDSGDSADFVAVVLAETERVWQEKFGERGRDYPEPRLVLFRNSVASACGTNSSAVGPFYCPADQKIYLDLGFFDTLQNRLGATGDFAAAYVVAHEVGHHIQTVSGISAKIAQQKQGQNETAVNQLSVRQELQADCFAGLWAHHAGRTRGLLEAGDIEEGLQAAAAIGDDTLQKKAGQTIRPESFTHGSSSQRAQWFRRGYESGTIESCDTFAGLISH